MFAEVRRIETMRGSAIQAFETQLITLSDPDATHEASGFGVYPVSSILDRQLNSVSVCAIIICWKFTTSFFP